MEKERRIKTLSVVALIIAVLGLTIAFAALSTTLTINGSASVDAASWDIHFDEESLYYEVSGDANINENPTISGTTILGMNMTITKPGDLAVYAIEIVNEGNINGKLNSITTPTLCTLQSSVESCDWNNDGVVTQEDIDKVNNNITLIVGDGAFRPIENGSILEKNNSTCVLIALVYGYFNEKDELRTSDELPKRNLNFSNLNVTLNYVQAD